MDFKSRTTQVNGAEDSRAPKHMRYQKCRTGRQNSRYIKYMWRTGRGGEKGVGFKDAIPQTDGWKEDSGIQKKKISKV